MITIKIFLFGIQFLFVIVALIGFVIGLSGTLGGAVIGMVCGVTATGLGILNLMIKAEP